jgi:DNA primase
MGSIFSRRQSDLLTRHFQSLILLLDGDAAGRHAADQIAQSFAIQDAGTHDGLAR